MRSSITLASILLFASVALADHGRRPVTAPLCEAGSFAVQGPPLVAAACDAPNDSVTLADGKVSIGTTCPATTAELIATPLGTVVRARWADCAGVKDVRLRARIDPGCANMNGMVGANRPSFVRQFVATRCNDSGSCTPPQICRNDSECGTNSYCSKRQGDCGGNGTCAPLGNNACPEIYQPVCGCDGRTYGNACMAAASGANVAKAGECPVTCDPSDATSCADDEYCQLPVGRCGDTNGRCAKKEGGNACPITAHVLPVCGCNGETYASSCEAAKAGSNVRHYGRCELVCGGIAGIACPSGQFCEYPVNSCHIADGQGRCRPEPEVCTRIFAPVCGCDGVTYSNDCERQRAHAILAHIGACRER